MGALNTGGVWKVATVDQYISAYIGNGTRRNHIVTVDR